jgi:hypothetical protein
MKLVKDIIGEFFLSKRVRLTSKCPNFPIDVKGTIISYRILNNETLLKIRTDAGKVYDIGSNMLELSYEFI